MTRYGFVVVGSSGAVGGFGVSPNAASRNASKKPPGYGLADLLPGLPDVE